MAKAIVMPKPGMTVDECLLSKWHKKVGDTVAKGEMLFSYETDKANFDEQSQEEGVLLAVFYNEGDDVPALSNICVIGKAGEDTKEFAPVKGEIVTAPAASAVPVATTAAPALAAPILTQMVSPTIAPINTNAAASPRAKALASSNGLAFSAASPTGPEGRIIERDIRSLMANGAAVFAAPAQAAPVLETYDIPHSNVRKFIAKAMHASLATMAQLTLNSSFDATEIMNLRQSLKNSKNPNFEKITLNDIVLFAVARTLLNFRNINANYYDDRLRCFGTVNLGIAVDTEKGLLVPKIQSAEQLSLVQLSAKAKELAKAANSGSISPDLLTGGTFTVTNLGAMGIESFTPVINPPEVAILGVCNVTERVRTEKGGLVAYPAMGLSLTIDHRAVDGAPAAIFLKELCNNLKNFNLLLV